MVLAPLREDCCWDDLGLLGSCGVLVGVGFHTFEIGMECHEVRLNCCLRSWMPVSEL